MLDKKWFVYKYTFSNGKVYIGKSYEGGNRFGKTSQYKGQLVFRAMQKYKTYIKEIVEYCETEDEAYERERYYIGFYQSQDPLKGYNVTSGGDGADPLTSGVPVEQYDINGKFIRSWDTITEAARDCKITSSCIVICCKNDHYTNVKTAAGFQWKYAGSSKKIYSLPAKYPLKPRPVLQYSLSGEFIKEWDSLKSAANYYKMNQGCIRRVCEQQRKTSKGFQWRFKDKFYPVTDLSNYTQKYKTTKIDQYALSGQFLKTWNSIKEITDFLKVDSSSISHNCMGDLQQVKGYIWKYHINK